MGLGVRFKFYRGLEKSKSSPARWHYLYLRERFDLARRVRDRSAGLDQSEWPQEILRQPFGVSGKDFGLLLLVVGWEIRHVCGRDWILAVIEKEYAESSVERF